MTVAFPRRALAAALTSAVVVAPIALAVHAQAAPGGTGVVISEVYGGGGNSGATYTNDFIELYNPTAAAVDLAGLSVQYRSSTNTTSFTAGNTLALSGSIPAYGHWLVQAAAGAGGTTPLPAPDQTTGIAMGGSAGQVVLADTTTPLTLAGGNVAGAAHVVDFVGYGTGTLAYEGSGPTPAVSNTTAASRDAAGTDTDNNPTDFTSGAPGPQNSGIVTPPPPPPTDATIEQIQGTGASSPLVGTTVHTSGVVTAAYPTGGFNGFYLQTPGTGGDLDLATHTASDGVFVYSPSEVGEVHIGDHVDVTGPVSEFNGLTEIGPTTNGVTVLDTPAEAVKPATVVLPRTAAQRESLEGMLVAPQGPYTVSDNYALNQYAEIGLAAGTTPLLQPTEVADAQDAAAVAAVVADNEARAVTLDDGATTNFLSGSNRNTPLPYLTTAAPIRVGAPVSFHDAVVLDWRNSTWKFEPTSQVAGDGQGLVTFGNTRQAAPAPVGGQVKVASFNVLNYFPTTGAAYVAAGGSCTFYNDREGNHITVNDCGPTGPRGAADDVNLARQQAKIVHAINGLGADVVSLEEIENSIHYGPDRDAAVSRLVDALNADAGSTVWAFVPTPTGISDQTAEDVIRTAFIYKVAAVQPVGTSMIFNDPAFDVARDPLAQGFKPVGAGQGSVFAVIVNHFKSKGSGPDDGTGQGNSNPQRIAEAQALVGFADTVKSTLRTDLVFLTGDFNSYTQEDPLQVLYAAGYTDVGSTLHPDEHTYLFDGVVGSLDHVLANGPAMQAVTGAHVWNINSVEPVALEYSRYNYNATQFYDESPFRASDHDPLVVGIDLPNTTPAVSVQVWPNPVPRKSLSVLTAHVTADGVVPTGRVQVYLNHVLVGTTTLHSGWAIALLPPVQKVGSYPVEVRYLGDRFTDPATGSTTLVVVKK